MPIISFTKELSCTDVGESKTHQYGICIPVKEGIRLFPEFMHVDVSDYREFQCKDHTGRIWSFRFTHKAKAHESRITPIMSYIRQYLIRSGDKLTFSRPIGNNDVYSIEYEEGYTPHLPGEESLINSMEGAVRRISVNQYERDPRCRTQAIQKHGVRCFGCRLELAEMYGIIARGYIQIHHVKPVSSGITKTKIDDLIPLCPNCHIIVHLKDPPLTVNELKDIIRHGG